ncbi:MAG TPA: TetR/AcrR family transcriptional regulator [Nevskiaceae bacterium]|nr:TetR/AcrR family transcriptional regulator [Nevskiaceae bacterium]
MNAAQSRIHAAAIRLFAEKGSTQLTVSELAQAAGIARGTVYNNLESPEALFESVAARLAEEMNTRIVASFAPDDEPPQRLASGVRHYIRRAHEEPHWGRFLCRFAFSHDALTGMWTGAPMRDVVEGLAKKQYDFRAAQLPSVIAVVAGSVLTSMFLVLEGRRTWRDAGSDAAELVLRALGVEHGAAQRLANSELPPLAAAT